MRRIPSEPSGEFDSGLEAQLKSALSSSVKEGRGSSSSFESGDC